MIKRGLFLTTTTPTNSSSIMLTCPKEDKSIGRFLLNHRGSNRGKLLREVFSFEIWKQSIKYSKTFMSSYQVCFWPLLTQVSLGLTGHTKKFFFLYIRKHYLKFIEIEICTIEILLILRRIKSEYQLCEIPILCLFNSLLKE